MIRTTLALVLALAACACAAPRRLAPLLAEDSPSRVPGEYVVIFEETVTDREVFTHVHSVQNLTSYYGNETNFVKDEYHIGSFRGYGAKMDDELRDIVRSMDHVQYVECGQYYHTMHCEAPCTSQASATWGIVRTAFRSRPTAEDYIYNRNTDGSGVMVYIIDTGIFTGHCDFGGRAFWGVDFIDIVNSPRTDLHGHGTHVAGTVMSNTWGVAKGATAIAVRVLDQNGRGSTLGVISGINWTAQVGSGRKSVANMSLGGRCSSAINSAVDAAVSAGVSFAVSAGNSNQDACSVSPASATDCVTVGASDHLDTFADFSNYGTCVDIIGPGVDITSTWLNGGTKVLSGTSMASPHVAGVMAKYLSAATMTPQDLTNLIIKEASMNKILGLTGAECSTPNLLIFKCC